MENGIYKIVMICTIRDVINLKLNAAKSTFIIWTTDINGPHHFVFQNFGDTLYKHSLFFFVVVVFLFFFFTWALIYKVCIRSVLLFLFYEGRFSDLNVLVPDVCSINGFCWHMVSKAVQLIYFWCI